MFNKKDNDKNKDKDPIRNPRAGTYHTSGAGKGHGGISHTGGRFSGDKRK